MGEPLKLFFDRALVEGMAARLPVDRPRFVQLALEGLEELELLDRAKHVAEALHAVLPDYPSGIRAVVAAYGPPLGSTEGWGMSPFYHLPFVYYIARWGLADFDASMWAQEEVTKRFSAEFSLRFFLAADLQRALPWLQRWAVDPDPHVRRLVSEGTRPRLPWAPRLVLADWTPIHALLTQLVDDPSDYVRRSVSNHLGDIYKDRPADAVALARAWARPDRMPLIRHGLRHAVKAKDRDALAILGADHAPDVEVSASFSEARIGGHVDVLVTLRGPKQRLVVDLAIDFVKPTGRTGRKVFRLGEVDLDGVRNVRKRIALRQLSTRTHAPGWHVVAVQVNGRSYAVGGFQLHEAL